jgi:hypothetical protein
MSFVSTLAALRADFELRCKSRQAGNFRQASSSDLSLVLGGEHIVQAPLEQVNISNRLFTRNTGHSLYLGRCQ